MKSISSQKQLAQDLTKYVVDLHSIILADGKKVRLDSGELRACSKEDRRGPDGVPGPYGVIATPGKIAKPGPYGTPGVLATPGKVAQPGPVAKPGRLAREVDPAKASQVRRKKAEEERYKRLSQRVKDDLPSSKLEF